jgi:hypothetical protein
MFDSQVTFDPAKEQLDAPAQLAEHSDRQQLYYIILYM